MTLDAPIILACLAGVSLSAAILAAIRWLAGRGPLSNGGVLEPPEPWPRRATATTPPKPAEPPNQVFRGTHQPGPLPPPTRLVERRAGETLQAPCICGHDRSAPRGPHLSCDACFAAHDCCGKFARQPPRPTADQHYLAGRVRMG